MSRIAFVLCVLLAACGSPIGPLDRLKIGRDAVAIPAPASARQLWTELEACSGLKGDFDAVKWFVEPNGIMVGGKWKQGVWLTGNVIVLAPPNLDDPWTIKHEEMHALLRGSPDHPAKYFNGACGNLMTFA